MTRIAPSDELWLEATLARAVLHALDQAVIGTDADGRVTYWNTEAERLYGWTADEAIGRSVLDVTPAESVRGAAGEIMEALRAGRTFAGEFLVQHRDGRRFPAWVVDTPIRNDSGELIGVVGISRDLTAQHRAAQELEQTREALRTRDEFLGVMSHELRTPLTAIIGYQQLLESGVSGPLTGKQTQHLDRMRSSAWHLLDLLEQMMSLARPGAPSDELLPEPVRVAELMRDVAALVEVQAAEKGLDLDVVTCADDVVIVTDPAKLRQVLLNLLSNAVKFTPAGRVAMSTEVIDAPSPGAATVVEFRIEDTGIGFGEEDRDRIFQPFLQLDRATTREAGGVGLGLAVVQRLLTVLGGTITVSSEPGVGSSFVVRIGSV
jgi:PAS domain S-box-containing protein